MAVRYRNLGKLNFRYACSTTLSAGTLVTLNSSSEWEAATDETEVFGILLADVIADPSAYYDTIDTFDGGTDSRVPSNQVYQSNPAPVAYGAGEYYTDQIATGVTATVGGKVYCDKGKVHTSAQNSGGAIGTFLTEEGTDGFVLISLK